MRRSDRFANALELLLAATLITVLSACGGGEGDPPTAQGDGAPAEAAADAAPTPAKRRLTGDRAEPGTASLDQLTRFDLKTALSAGQISIETNDARFKISTDLLFDGKTDTLLVGGGMNPVELTLTLDRPVRLRAARATFAGSTHDWVIEPVPGQRRLVASAPEHDWSQVDFDPAVESGVVRFEFLRLERDDYVHVGEVELYTEPTP